jgi:hypothetical protein
MHAQGPSVAVEREACASAPRLGAATGVSSWGGLRLHHVSSTHTVTMSHSRGSPWAEGLAGGSVIVGGAERMYLLVRVVYWMPGQAKHRLVTHRPSPLPETPNSYHQFIQEDQFYMTLSAHLPIALLAGRNTSSRSRRSTSRPSCQFSRYRSFSRTNPQFP